MKKNSYLSIAWILNPLVITFYGIGCYALSRLMKYGGVARRLPIIIICFTTLFFWFFWCFYQIKKKHRTNKANEEPISRSSKHLVVSKVWMPIAILALFSITGITGVNIYQSAIPFQGKLAFFIHDLKYKKEIEFAHNNLFEDKLDGFLRDIQKVVDLPEEMFLSSEFDLTFNKEGQITSLYTFLYGKNEKGETETFLIDYDESKSEKLALYLNGYAKEEYNEEKRIAPLFEGIRILPIKETVFQWNKNEFGLYYEGYRNWGADTSGIVFYNENGPSNQITDPKNEINGYTISIYLPQESNESPVRFVAASPKLATKPTLGSLQSNDDETFFLTEDTGYRLVVTDAAAGSRFYALELTKDGGQTWERLNEDPFLGSTGVASGLKFIDQDLGFLGLSHGGGSSSDLYRTIDGGKTLEKVHLPSVEVPLNNSETYDPFDFPEMPDEENGALFLLAGQGQDGDYNGGSKALYRSYDKGESWEFVKETH